MDLIIYINLDRRTDRRGEMEAEYKRLQIPESKVLRWSATAVPGRGPRGGPLGCLLSHLAVLQHILTLSDSVQTVLVNEDDFNFVDDTELVSKSLDEFLAYPRDSWDMVLLSYHVVQSKPYNDLVSQSFYSHGTAGYLINRSAVPRLIKLLEEARDGSINTGEERFVIDVYWHHFMQNGKCFYFNKPLGYQRKSLSDIQGTVQLNPSYVD